MKTRAQNIVELETLADALLSPCYLGLYQNNIIPTDETTLADLSVATFSGYGMETIAEFGPPIQNVDGTASIVAPLVQFEHDGGITPNTIYGGYLTDDLTTPTILMYVFPLEEPKEMVTNTDGLPVVAKLTLNPNG